MAKAKKAERYISPEGREGLRQGGFSRRGPMRKPKKADVVSDTGYVVPEGYAGTRNLERNIEIRDTLDAAAPEDKPKVTHKLAKKFKIADKTVEHVYRYFRAPEEEEKA